MEIHFTFYTILAAIIKLFVLMSIGYGLYYWKVIDDKFTDMLSLTLVRVIFPALIISKTISNFSFSEYAFWWVLPIVAIVFSLIGMLLGSTSVRFLNNFNSQKEFICSSGFQNCGYLPMNLIAFAFTGVVEDRLLIYLFLFILGFNILVWSLVPLFLSGKLKSDFKMRVFLNPPVVATIFSLLWVTIAGKGSMPAILRDPIAQLGQAAFPIAMMTLGAYLCRYAAHLPKDKVAVIVSALIKLAVFPLIILIALKFVPIGMDYKFFLFLQSIMPTAVSLVVIGSYTGADNEFFSASIFYTHLVAIFSIPLWLAAFRMFLG